VFAAVSVWIGGTAPTKVLAIGAGVALLAVPLILYLGRS
jgi:hypothetical protein